MNCCDFIYRQKQRLKYHIATNDIEKKIAKINLKNELIKVKSNSYFVESINLEVPKWKFNYIFTPYYFDLFIANSKGLNGQYSIEQDRLFFSFDRFKINITSGSELFIINEIFFKKCYQFKLPNAEKCIVIDIGFNVGLASLYFSSLSYVKKVYSFEPFAPTYKLGLINLNLNKKLADRIISYNLGLGAKNEIIEVQYNPTNRGINVSLVERSGIKTNITEKLEIRDSYEEVSKLINLEPKEQFILKVDCEGAEYLIFNSLFSRGLPDNIIGIILEWHFKSAKDLERALLGEGFKIISTVLSQNSGFIYAFR